jgi:hypothetical protein
MPYIQARLQIFFHYSNSDLPRKRRRRRRGRVSETISMSGQQYSISISILVSEALLSKQLFSVCVSKVKGEIVCPRHLPISLRTLFGDPTL